jgi:hypothetical protein
MIERDAGTEPVECVEVVYRALKKGWSPGESIPSEAFMRKVRGLEAEEGVSLSRQKYTTARECRLKLKRMRGTASLHVGKVRDLPFGIDVLPAPVRDVDETITDPGHCILINLPDPVNDDESAEFAASQLIKIARFVTPEQEDNEYRKRTDGL